MSLRGRSPDREHINYRGLVRARILVQIAVMALFLAAFIGIGRIGTAIADIVAKTQVMPSFIAMVLGGGGAAFLAWIVIVAVTLVFGRVYCSTLCPLGILQDAIAWVLRFRFGRRHRRYRYMRPSRRLFYVVFGVSVGLMFLGIPFLINLLEPYRFFGMFVHDFVTPVVSLAGHASFAILKAVGVYTAPGDISFDAVLFIVSFLLVAGLTTSVVLRGRWYCNTLCPAGAMLSLPATVSLLGIRIDSELCTGCRRCEAVCRAGCIDVPNRRIDADRCVGCFSCLSECRFDALHYGRRRTGPVSGPADEATIPDRETRRSFLKRIGTATRSSAFLFPVGFFLRRRTITPDGTPQTPVAPPGSRSIARFHRLCISCHLCVSRCPTGVLQPSLLEYGAAGIMQPTLDFAHGFCEYECNICSAVCPTHAIIETRLPDKKLIKIGNATFSKERCVVVSNGTACGACAEVCPTNAVRMVPYRDGLDIPQTHDEYCIGCGNCEYACPVTETKAIYVTGEAIHGNVKPPEAIEPRLGEPAGAESNTKKDSEFPF